MSNAAVVFAATDWSKVTAEATVVLAAITAVLAVAAIAAAVLARRGLKTAAEDLKATHEATEAGQAMAQRQIEASYRPLLIDVAPSGPVDNNDDLLASYSAPRIRLDFPGGHTDDIDPRHIYVHLTGPWMSVAVPLRNVGQGLAVIDPQHITAHGQRVGEMASCEVQRKRVPPGEATRVVCTPRLDHGQVAAYPWILSLRVPYCDFAGGQAAVVLVQLEQRNVEDEWRLRDVEQIEAVA
jgi:hypothetical protein